MYNIFYLEDIVSIIISYLKPKYTYMINNQWNILTKRNISKQDNLLQCYNMIRINDMKTFKRVHLYNNIDLINESLKLNRFNFISYLSKIPYYKKYISKRFIFCHLQDELLLSVKLNNIRKFDTILSIDLKFDLYQCLRVGIDKNRLLMIKKMLKDKRFDPNKLSKLGKLASFNKNTNMINVLYKHNGLILDD